MNRFLRTLSITLITLFLTFEVSYANPKIHFLGIVGWDEYVFDHEVREASNILSKLYPLTDPIHILSNYQNPRIESEQIAKEFATLSLQSDKEDLFMIFLSSHGQREGVAFKNKDYYGHVSPANIKDLIQKTKMKNVILIVSACYSGVFKSLATDNILVITASRHDRTSFGCQPDNQWTFFGEAFFRDSLPRSKNLIDAFTNAKKIISAAEAELKLLPSEPQIAGGRNILPFLDFAQQ